MYCLLKQEGDICWFFFLIIFLNSHYPLVYICELFIAFGLFCGITREDIVTVDKSLYVKDKSFNILANFPPKKP